MSAEEVHQAEATVKVYLTLVEGVWVIDSTTMQPGPLDGDLYCNMDGGLHGPCPLLSEVPDLPSGFELGVMFANYP